VLETGGPVLTPWRGKVKALLEAWYPGQQGGPALARVLFGDVDPGGRLPVTFPQDESQLPTAGDPEKYPGTTGGDVHYKEGVLIGYRWYDAKDIAPAYPFGHGLSYTTFAYSNLRVATPAVGARDSVRVSVTVTNTGRRAGKETVLLYVRDVVASVTPPVRRLRRFEKITLEPGASRTVSFALAARELSFVGRDEKLVLEPGAFEAIVGPLTAPFEVTSRP